jgi:oligosaccharyltransferase complex subunit alpha (ribophorin I)
MIFNNQLISVLTVWTTLWFGKVYSESISAGLVNKNVDISIDISSQLVKISHKVTLENTAKSPSKFFLLATDPKIKDNISFLGAQVSIKILYLTNLFRSVCCTYTCL